MEFLSKTWTFVLVSCLLVWRPLGFSIGDQNLFSTQQMLRASDSKNEAIILDLLILRVMLPSLPYLIYRGMTTLTSIVL